LSKTTPSVESRLPRPLFPTGRKHSKLALVGQRRADLKHDSDELLMEVISANGIWITDSGKIVSNTETPRETHANLSRLLKKARILVWEAEAESSRFTYVSDQAEQMLGYPLADWYEPGFLAQHIHPEDQPTARTRREDQSSVVSNDDLTFRMVARDGRVVWLHNFVNVSGEDGKQKRLTGFIVDISEQKNAEAALKDLGGRLIGAQEKERARIAGELHDDFSQRLALLSIELEQLGKNIQKSREASQLFDQLKRHAREISADIHRLSHRLHPSKLDHLGLGAAVKSLCEELSEGAKLKIDFQQDGFPSTLPNEVALCVFRIAQEALRNCIRHSGAKSAQVLLWRTRSAVRLSVSDNGCGFDPRAELKHSGLGFISMRERLHNVGGEMQVYSKQQNGTRIEVSVPVVSKIEFGDELGNRLDIN
jgi:PAS domain S-box-containing protein